MANNGKTYGHSFIAQLEKLIRDTFRHMYNFKNETIPLFFPVLEGVQLQPWFSPSMLDKGLELIRRNKINDFTASEMRSGLSLTKGQL